VKVLLDTCCIIWAVSSPDFLSRTATDLLQAEDSEVFVSPISSAEIACAVERGRIKLNQHWKTWFRHYTGLNKWQLENIDLTIIEEAYSLPESFHDDPVDRILTATARVKNFTLLTADKKILDYPHVSTMW
jgi:PIN domain nuclease of toxin-antitoxin system